MPFIIDPRANWHTSAQPFSQPNYSILLLLRQNRAVESGPLPLQPTTPPPFIGKFHPVQHSLLAALRFTSVPPSGPLPVQPATNVNFLAKPWPVSFVVLPLLRANVAADFSSGVSFETNTHFIGKFHPVIQAVLPSLRISSTPPGGPLPAQPETNVSFISKPWPVAFAVLPLLRMNVAADFSSATSFETNPHFLGRFTAPVHLRLSFNHQPFDFDPTPAPHFVPRHQPVAFARFAAPRQNQATDVRVVEANPHFLGQFHQPQLALLRGLWQTPATDQIIVGAQEANPHFIARPWPVHHVVHPLLRQNSENVVSFRQVLAVANVTDEPVSVALPFDQRVFGITSSEQPG